MGAQPSDVRQPKAQEQGGQQRESRFGRQIGKWRRNVGKPKFQLEVLAILGLLVYTCETHRTNNLTREGLDNIRDQTRPYIFAEPAIVTRVPGVDTELNARQALDLQLATAHQLTLDISLVNAGASLAKVTARRPTQIAIGRDAQEIAEKCDVPFEPASQIIAPQGPNPEKPGTVLTAAKTRPLTDDEISSLKDPKTNFTVIWFGGIEYTSLRGGEYYTPYCFRFLPTGMAMGTCHACGDLR
jgi:hypothetical protein